MKNWKYAVAACIALTLLTIIICTFFGAANISLSETLKILGCKLFGLFQNSVAGFGPKVTIIWQLRFPRTLLAFLVGGTMALCGSVYQALFKNPMADPFVLGISSGAAFGATVAMLFMPATLLGMNGTSLFAFAGAVFAIFFVYNVARVGRQTHLTSLLLSGIAMSQFLTALISFLMMLASNEMKKIYFWTLGSFAAKSWNHFFVVLPYAMIGAIIIYVHNRDLDIIMLGDESAVRFGVETEKVKRTMFFVSALMMAACVSVSGIIGFVGLIAPHIVRLFSGPIHKRLLPVSFLLGGIMLMVCDTLARSVIASEIPVGIVTAIIGAPFFIYLLRAKKTEVM